MVMHYSQKSYCYFVEFIEQMNKSNDLIKINCKDAILFMYRKTIYDINQNFRKDFICDENSKEILNYTYKGINSYLIIYINLLNYNYKIENLTSKSLKLIELFNKINYYKNDYIDILEMISIIIIYLINKNIPIEKCYKIIEEFICVISLQTVNIETIEKNLINNIPIDDLTIEKFVKKLII